MTDNERDQTFSGPTPNGFARATDDPNQVSARSAAGVNQHGAGVFPPTKEIEEMNTESTKSFSEPMRKLWDTLEAAGIDKAIVLFSGCDGEGGVNSVAFGSDEAAPAVLEGFNRDAPIGPHGLSLCETMRQIAQITQQLLWSAAVPDWCAGEGGEGELLWNVNERTLDLLLDRNVLTVESSAMRVEVSQ